MSDRDSSHGPSPHLALAGGLVHDQVERFERAVRHKQLFDLQRTGTLWWPLLCFGCCSLRPSRDCRTLFVDATGRTGETASCLSAPHARRPADRQAQPCPPSRTMSSDHSQGRPPTNSLCGLFSTTVRQISSCGWGNEGSASQDSCQELLDIGGALHLSTLSALPVLNHQQQFRTAWPWQRDSGTGGAG